jgi:hypothetical protein
VGCTDGEVGYLEAEEGIGTWSEIIPPYRELIGYFMHDFLGLPLSSTSPRDVANPWQNPGTPPRDEIPPCDIVRT